ncbi:MAG: phytanoyl-CoA dioxygenase family protein [Boseongicola sp. SB0664_bin_43]|uniref:Phytanoyl-CoA dioxygenase family protein n=1 Tax=Boseongicola sp. SB0664_bin_43 TaxID=2604844 RepID=A0A6B0Y2T2_9RHOB|nr:phytanoyl-CoA dioxygenase family protein [Boseongicola sp. SB0664_bin_43]
MTIKLEDGRLPEEDIAQYWRDGFLFPVPVFSAEETVAARTSLEDMERDWLDAGLPLPLNTYKRVNAHVVMPFVVDVARHPAILDAVEGILGPDILIYAAEFFIKEPRTTSIVSMHQDLTYWGLGAIDGLVTAWLALSPATVASGCMDFVRGSHKQPILPHEDTFDANNLLSRGQEVRVDIADEDKTPIMLEPGEMSLHHGLTIHGSGPNGSDDRRIGCVIRYVRPDMQQEVGAVDYAMAARGQDRFGNFVLVPAPTSLFAPEALELYEKMRAAQAKVLMRDAKKPTGIYA